MKQQRRSGTRPEVQLRKYLFGLGLRYRLELHVPGTRRIIDIAFPRYRVAVDVRGCFWHQCPMHGTYPVANAEWWRSKLDGNAARDLDTADRLASAGWALVTVWEHERPEEAGERIVTALEKRSRTGPGMKAG